jgi:hypothetical protein
LQTCRPLITEYKENNCLGGRIGRDFEQLAVYSLTKVNTGSRYWINPLNAELNPICYLLALLGGATIVDVSRLRVKVTEDFPFPFAHGRKSGAFIA